MKLRPFAAAVGSGLLALTTASAHHSFSAEYDANQPITLTGTVTLLEWTNPHARLYIDVTGDDGETVNWDLELGPPTVLMRQGWRRDSLEPGTVVTVNGFRSREEPLVANARSVTLADGRRVFAGSSFDTSEGAE
ncbi:MAG: DUF6152 family protein [Gammaproteobacteria bacterium]|nr:DUF6152 family protein [Gammaproteobacteria bacterium]